jgi:hypothetical protein
VAGANSPTRTPGNGARSEALTLFEDAESPGAQRAMEALLTMKKLDMAALQEAHDSVHTGAR